MPCGAKSSTAFLPSINNEAIIYLKWGGGEREMTIFFHLLSHKGWTLCHLPSNVQPLIFHRCGMESRQCNRAGAVKQQCWGDCRNDNDSCWSAAWGDHLSLCCVSTMGEAPIHNIPAAPFLLCNRSFHTGWINYIVVQSLLWVCVHAQKNDSYLRTIMWKDVLYRVYISPASQGRFRETAETVTKEVELLYRTIIWAAPATLEQL